jgi:hypothetical protein
MTEKKRRHDVEYQRAWRAKNAEITAEYRRKYYEANREELLRKQRAKRAADLEGAKVREARYRQKRKAHAEETPAERDARLNYGREWYHRNRKHVNEKRALERADRLAKAALLAEQRRLGDAKPMVDVYAKAAAGRKAREQAKTKAFKTYVQRLDNKLKK